MNIDRKYQIRALNPCSGNTHDEHDSILFLAKDKAVPAKRAKQMEDKS